MSDTTIGNDDTDTSTNEDQSSAQKTYTQEEVNAMMAKTKGNLAKKYERQYADLGDVDELRALKTEAEKRRQDEQIKRGQFEETLKELASKKDAEIQKRDAMIAEFKLNTPLLETAAKFRAVKPEQVRDLLKHNVRLNSDGEPEVIDATGKVRYSDKGAALSVADLVQSFLNDNPHFVSATPATTNTKSSHNAELNKVDIAKLDMGNPAHREIYKKYRAEHGIA